MAGLRYKWPAAEAIENRLANMTVRGGMWILDRVERRMAKAHPALTFARPERQQSGTFAAGCSPYKIILLFFIGAFLGDITETIFCRVTGGEWMSRSSVGVGAVLHRVGPGHRHGPPAALSLQGQARQLAVRHGHAAGRCGRAGRRRAFRRDGGDALRAVRRIMERMARGKTDGSTLQGGQSA